MCGICSKLTIKTLERRYWRCSGFFIGSFEHISHFFLVWAVSWAMRKCGKIRLILTRFNPFLSSISILYFLEKHPEKWLHLWEWIRKVDSKIVLFFNHITFSHISFVLYTFGLYRLFNTILFAFLGWLFVGRCW